MWIQWKLQIEPINCWKDTKRCIIMIQCIITNQYRSPEHSANVNLCSFSRGWSNNMKSYLSQMCTWRRWDLQNPVHRMSWKPEQKELSSSHTPIRVSQAVVQDLKQSIHASWSSSNGKYNSNWWWEVIDWDVVWVVDNVDNLRVLHIYQFAMYSSFLFFITPPVVRTAHACVNLFIVLHSKDIPRIRWWSVATASGNYQNMSIIVNNWSGLQQLRCIHYLLMVWIAIILWTGFRRSHLRRLHIWERYNFILFDRPREKEQRVTFAECSADRYWFVMMHWIITMQGQGLQFMGSVCTLIFIIHIQSIGCARDASGE